VREEWDVTFPGCPMLPIDHRKWGSGGSVRDTRVKTVTQIMTLGPVDDRRD